MLAMTALSVFVLSKMVLSGPAFPFPTETHLDIGDEHELKDQDDYVEVCSQEPVELALVIDSSVSILEEAFKKGQAFLSDFLSGYDIGPGKTQVRVAAVTFGRGVYEKDSFNLNTYKTKQEVLDHVTHMTFRHGTRTDTGDAIRHMREVQMSNTRPWVPKVAIVLTDGNSQRRSWTKSQASLARADNITVFAVGVGRSVSFTELLNIAGHQDRVIRVSSYEDLTDIKEQLAYRTCVLKPRPTSTTPATSTTTTPATTTTTTPKTTTTATPQAEQPCSVRAPSDVTFIFNPASLGLDAVSRVTQFIANTITTDGLQAGFRYGVVSGSCPDDSGFPLNAYSKANDLRAHLAKYDANRLPALVRHAAKRAFGARPHASKVAIVFIGKEKVDTMALNAALEELLDKGVNVFVSPTDQGVRLTELPSRVHLLDYGSSMSQAAQFVSHLCYPSTTSAPPTTPVPVTTTSTAQVCSLRAPSDVTFVFSPASLGLDAVSRLTQLIAHTVTTEGLQAGFRYGVVSGSCPDDSGFPLNAYSKAFDLRAHLARYDANKLPTLVRHTATRAFGADSGGRPHASKMAVVFLGKEKVDKVALSAALDKLLDMGVAVFLSPVHQGALLTGLPSRVRLLNNGSPITQAAQLVSHLCKVDKAALSAALDKLLDMGVAVFLSPVHRGALLTGLPSPVRLLNNGSPINQAAQQHSRNGDS